MMCVSVYVYVYDKTSRVCPPSPLVPHMAHDNHAIASQCRGRFSPDSAHRSARGGADVSSRNKERRDAAHATWARPTRPAYCCPDRPGMRLGIYFGCKHGDANPAALGRGRGSWSRYARTKRGRGMLSERCTEPKWRVCMIAVW